MKKIFGLAFLYFAGTMFVFAQNSSSTLTATATSENNGTEISNTEVVKLSIDEAVNYALQNSRTLKSNDIDLELKERASKYSWNVFLPTLQATGTMSRTNEFSPATAASNQLMNQLSGGLVPAKTGYDKEEDRWSTVGSLSASWNFTPAYIAKIRISKAQYEAGLVTWEKSQKETITNIKKAYYGLLLQQESLKIKKTSLENARRRMIQAQTNFKNGSIPEIQFLQTQVNYENTKPEVDSAEQSLVQQEDLFAFMIGLPVGTKFELTSSIEPVYVDVETEELLAKYAENDLQIKSLKKNIEAAKLGITANDLATWVPTLALNYAYQPVYIGNEGSWHFSKDLGKDSAWYDSGSFSASLVWNITNMLPWSSNRQQAKDYKQQLVQLQLNIETLKENQKVQVRKAVDTLHQAKEQIDAMERNVKVAQRAYDMTVRSYQSGTTELLDLRDAEASLNQAKLGQINQKFQYISALMDLENTLNVDLKK